MDQMWNVGQKSVIDLIEMVDNSRLALPQFQRPSVWGKAQWIPFLHTILLRRPTGTLLLLEVKGDLPFSPRKLETAPDIDPSKVEWLLLDGQQRTTTLYQAVSTSFGSAGRHKKILIDVRAALERGELLEDDLQLVPAGKVSPPVDLARQGRIEFSTLLRRGEFTNWQTAFANRFYDGDSGAVAEEIETVIAGLHNVGTYAFPVLEIKAETPLEVVADIFENMNRRGQQLNKFDLMVARLYRAPNGDEYYDLRSEWESALEDAPNLRRLGIAMDHGMLPLQLIAKQVSRLPEGVRGQVKNLSSASVLELEPIQVMGDKRAAIPKLNLRVAVEALERAARFLVEHCGVVAPQLLPQQAMLLPIADQFLRESLYSGSRLSDSKLKRWFFSAGLFIDYYGSVNSYADRDCKRLEQWLEDDRVPETVRSVDRKYVESVDLRMAFRREGNIRGKAVTALLVSSGARDWSVDSLEVRTYDSVDYHHIVPDQKLAQWYPKQSDERQPIAAFAPLWATTNRSIGSKAPDSVVKDLGAQATAIMQTHHLDIDLLKNAYSSREAFEMFVADREKRLRQFIIEALDL